MNKIILFIMIVLSSSQLCAEDKEYETYRNHGWSSSNKSSVGMYWLVNSRGHKLLPTINSMHIKMTGKAAEHLTLAGGHVAVNLKKENEKSFRTYYLAIRVYGDKPIESEGVVWLISFDNFDDCEQIDIEIPIKRDSEIDRNNIDAKSLCEDVEIKWLIWKEKPEFVKRRYK